MSVQQPKSPNDSPDIGFTSVMQIRKLCEGNKNQLQSNRAFPTWCPSRTSLTPNFNGGRYALPMSS